MLTLLGHSLRPLPASPSEPSNGLFCVKPGFSLSPGELADRGAFFPFLSFRNIQGSFLFLWSALSYLSGMSSRIYILPGSVCHCFQIKNRPRSTAFMTLEGLSGTFWACWASQYLHFHLLAVRGWLPLVANWWLAVPDQEAQGCGKRHQGALPALYLPSIHVSWPGVEKGSSKCWWKSWLRVEKNISDWLCQCCLKIIKQEVKSAVQSNR